MQLGNRTRQAAVRQMPGVLRQKLNNQWHKQYSQEQYSPKSHRVRGPGSRKIGRKRLKASASCSKKVSWPSYDCTTMCATPADAAQMREGDRSCQAAVKAGGWCVEAQVEQSVAKAVQKKQYSAEGHRVRGPGSRKYGRKRLQGTIVSWP
jgi:hypothetical protein